MIREEAIAPLGPLCVAYCAEWELHAVGGSFPGDAMAISVILWDGDGRPDPDWLALIDALEAAAAEASRALGVCPADLTVWFQSDARDTESSGGLLLALSALFPEDVRANPSAHLAALADPVRWRGVLTPPGSVGE